MSLGTQQAYAYSSEPRAAGESKYRDEGSAHKPYKNIMFDRRVVRGSTYAAQVTLQSSQEPASRPRKKKRRAKESQGVVPGGPVQEVPPVDGRSHIHIQTDNYLEELTDKLPEEDSSTQTDAWMDLPQLPLFIPTKTGVDKATQIEEGDLFDFDVEVNPILEVLVGKALEHSMNEVLEEEELAAIRQHQREYEHLRNLEIAEVKRLEAEASRRNAEKERRMQQERARLAREAEVSEKLAARKYAKEYLTDLHSNVFDNLMEAGVFYDPLEKEVGEVFLPSLLAAAAEKSSSKAVAAALARGLVLSAAKRLKERRQAVYDQIEKAKAEEEARLAEEQAKAEAKAAEEAEGGGDTGEDGD